MGFFERETRNLIGLFLIITIFLHHLTLLAEEGLLDRNYNGAHQAFEQGNFLVSISGLEKRLTGLGTDGEHGIEVA